MTAWRDRVLRALRRVLGRAPRWTRANDAYRLWASSYDAQPDNVILRLEGELFGALLAEVALAGAVVLDVGCGTGRHWPAVRACGPARLIGADPSPEMIAQLLRRFPDAEVHVRSGTDLGDLPPVDVLLSTLALGHIRTIGAAFAEWARVVRPGGALLLTDFHPDAFARGLKRTFRHEGRVLEVENHLHPVPALRAAAEAAGLDVVAVRARAVDATVRPLFERQGRGAEWAAQEGRPMILGLHLQKRA